MTLVQKLRRNAVSPLYILSRRSAIRSTFNMMKVIYRRTLAFQLKGQIVVLIGAGQSSRRAIITQTAQRLN